MYSVGIMPFITSRNMSIDKFYKLPLVYRNRKYVSIRFPSTEYYPIRMYDSEYVCCIRVANETDIEYPHVEYVEQPMDFISKRTIAKRIDKQTIFECQAIEETSFGVPFVVKSINEYIYLSIGGNFAIAFGYEARNVPYIVNIPRDIYHRMYIVEHEAIISIFKLFLNRLKKKDSFFDKVRSCLSSSNVYLYCDYLVGRYGNGNLMRVNINDYYVRRALEKILEVFLDLQWT